MTHTTQNITKQQVVAAIATSGEAYEATDSWLLGIFDSVETAHTLLTQNGWSENDYTLEGAPIEVLSDGGDPT